MESLKTSKVATDRRKFIFRSSQAVIGAALVSSALPSSAGDADSYLALDSSAKQLCGTCQHWGGRRRISADGKSLEIDGLGWCNNPKSPNYRKTTGPKGGMKLVWEKWSEIPA
ncbi:MAG TPA: hypothetical protein ENH48_06130 [Halieaceae bacterium]|nr:MAG: hypothetical protein DRQ98_02200 [Gammaproteobacteria bacterium]HDY82517.1 hypothetical protein [Halieaceae bacterium]